VLASVVQGDADPVTLSIQSIYCRAGVGN